MKLCAKHFRNKNILNPQGRPTLYIPLSSPFDRRGTETLSALPKVTQPKVVKLQTVCSATVLCGFWCLVVVVIVETWPCVAQAAPELAVKPRVT